ncbi:hypothetical protein KIW84_024473 [Lathyrus oleraceus]|uniref:DDE Tnp4 domain-containing protein n=1 Tax=Pisum sativum TaxID=3888 RepID=A0A9D4YJF0_PEA|nr:hypothetical protein KIW84_024473 [Pisum sativum]
MFTYVYSGWEGSAHDSKILLDAITNQNAEFPWPPRGSFYLVDYGYPCIGGFLPPYRGERIWEEMDPIDLEGIQEGPIIEGTSSNVDNLTRLSNEGAVVMIMKRNHIRDEMWVHRSS